MDSITYDAECSDFSTLPTLHYRTYVTYVRYKSVDRNNRESVRYANVRHRHRRDFCSKEHQRILIALAICANPAETFLQRTVPWKYSARVQSQKEITKPEYLRVKKTISGKFKKFPFSIGTQRKQGTDDALINNKAATEVQRTSCFDLCSALARYRRRCN